jgi:hypothetical protein
MVEDQDYSARSQHFEELAAGSADSVVAAAYRTLAAGYRALNYWHQRWRSPPIQPNQPEWLRRATVVATEGRWHLYVVVYTVFG